MFVDDSGENNSSAPPTFPRTSSSSSNSVRPGVNVSHHGKNSSVGPESLATIAFACDLAADDEPRKIVVFGINIFFRNSVRLRPVISKRFSSPTFAGVKVLLDTPGNPAANLLFPLVRPVSPRPCPSQPAPPGRSKPSRSFANLFPARVRARRPNRHLSCSDPHRPTPEAQFVPLGRKFVASIGKLPPPSFGVTASAGKFAPRGSNFPGRNGNIALPISGDPPPRGELLPGEACANPSAGAAWLYARPAQAWACGFLPAPRPGKRWARSSAMGWAPGTRARAAPLTAW